MPCCYHFYYLAIPILPLSFYEIIFILFPPVFCIKESELSYAHAQQKMKMTTPSRGRAMAFHSDFRGGKSIIVTNT